MALGTKVNGAWKTPSGVSVKVSGSWKKVQNIWVKVSGAWRPVWTAALTLRQGGIWGSNSYVSKQADHVELYAYNPNTGGGDAAVVTNTLVDLTNVTYVDFDFALEGSIDSRSDAIFIASKEQMGDGSTFNARTYQGLRVSRATKSLNVAGLSGYYYLRAHASVNGDATYWKRVRLYRILLDGREIWNGSNSWTYI
ncbi:hypothetical protein P4H61_01765 [Paenibacillus peoriae]|uniref:hypothetical protein n=1 Tax=Paenibacillus peoriae TaxID=59893 RepID=UPI00026C5E92|nr:hypothetical protein [Paenibacillus peoriae]MEC0180226.1 hypothetical protein [Paenibacillus peoriae]